MSYRLILFTILTLFKILSAQEGEFRLVFISDDTSGTVLLEGSSTLIIAPNGVTILVDCGEKGNTGGNIVLGWLKKLGIDHLNYVVITHNHSDHYGGVLNLIDEIAIDTIITHNYILKTLQGNFARRQIEPGDTIYLSRCSYLFCVASAGKTLLGRPSGRLNENARSIAFVVNYDFFQAFVGGDITGYTPNIESLVAPFVGDIELLSANHHGSSTSSNPFFIRTLSPQVTFISRSFRVKVSETNIKRFLEFGPVYYPGGFEGIEIPEELSIRAKERCGTIIASVPYEGALFFTIETSKGQKAYYVMDEAPTRFVIP